MLPLRSLARPLVVATFALSLPASGCFPSSEYEELVNYCIAISAIDGVPDYEDCGYSIPDEIRVVQQYADDFDAYRKMRESSITGPQPPSPAEFMQTRYSDWPARARALEAELEKVRAARSAPSASTVRH